MYEVRLVDKAEACRQGGMPRLSRMAERVLRFCMILSAEVIEGHERAETYEKSGRVDDVYRFSGDRSWYNI